MGPLIAVMIAALVALVVLAIGRGRMVSIALAGSECPDCRVPLVRVADAPMGPRPAFVPVRGGLSDGDGDRSSHDTSAPADPHSTWEVYACPDCDRVVTTVRHLPSPLAECPACHQRSLVVYAERAEGQVVVDEWCDLCGRRGRTTLEAPPRAPVGGSESERKGRVLPFKRGT